MTPAAVLLEEISDAYIANLQPTCSSSSSGVTCAHIELDSDDPDADDDETVEKEMEASDPMASRWTDSKHSSYLDFMEQSFVRDLYEREYCALDVCGQPSQGHRRHHHHHHLVEEAHDADSAESRSPTPSGPMEFKMWENGNWTWRVDSKRKVHHWTVLSNPWVKHFRTRASTCGSDMSNTTLPKNGGQGEPQISCSFDLNIPDGNPGSVRGMEIGGEGDYNALEAKHCIQQLFHHEDSRPRKRTAQLLENDQATSMRRRAHFWLDEGNMRIGVSDEVCEGSDQEGNHAALW